MNADDLRQRVLISKDTVTRRLLRCEQASHDVSQGLHGNPFTWRECDQALIGMLEDMGVHLISITKAIKLGYVLKQRQQPVGKVYYGAPLSRYADLYILECQFHRKEK